MSSRALNISDIYSSEHGRLQKLVRRLVGSKAMSEDLVHQAFLKAMVQQDEPENWPAYLTRAVRNLAINHLRDTLRKSEVVLADHDYLAIGDTAPTPEIIALHRCELRQVLKAVAALPPRRREAFVLHKFEGLSYDDIAARQQVSRNTVISQIVAALMDLKRSFEPD